MRRGNAASTTCQHRNGKEPGWEHGKHVPLQAFVAVRRDGEKTQVKSVRCARTTRRIRYALAGPEIQALNWKFKLDSVGDGRFARQASSKISFVFVPEKTLVKLKWANRHSPQRGETDTGTDPTQFHTPTQCARKWTQKCSSSARPWSFFKLFSIGTCVIELM